MKNTDFAKQINCIKKNPNQSYIISVDNSQLVKKFITEILANLGILTNDYLIVKPETESLKIAEVKKISQKLSLKAQGEKFLVAILSGEKMTPTAANSLLKIIEEPPKNSLIIIFTENTDKIIPTILSRCAKLRLRERFNQVDNKEVEIFKKIIAAKNISQKFKLVSEIVVEEIDIKKMLLAWMSFTRTNHQPEKQKTRKKIYQTLKKYSAGVNKKLLLENLVLNINF